ncbi:Fibronectin type III domain protein [uncultured Paludibacter sp.]|uniref:Fibronectin type III domain protein n=1 Tax=uncultured Paludibacter sp. TaxID=497635 RepID=A0A653AL73_9BACT|nr:Fibronectin type III domain protein [uncultured Paludibacter sp.]
MKTINKLIYFVMLFATTFIVSCSNDFTEYLETQYARLFSPINLTAKIQNKVDVKLTWTVSDNVESYVVEVYENDSLTFSGTPVMTISDITPNQVPYTITGLKGETKYSARVKAVSSSVDESKWTGVYFKTDAENIFFAFEDGDIQATSVTLRWPAGQTATDILITPGDITHTLTTDEIAAGVVTITGLTGETEYTAKLMNGTSTRGTATFTTLVDLGGAIAVYPTDDLAALLAAANSGDAFALYPGNYGSTTKFVVPVNVEIKAVYPNDRPILNGYISLENGSSLLMKELIMDGTGLTDGNQTIVFNTAATTYGGLDIEGCEIKNYVKGLYYVNVASTVESIIINNNIIHDIECSGGDFMDCRTGVVKVLTFTNNTVYNSAAARDFIRMDDSSGTFSGITSQITIGHNTLYKVSNTDGKRLLYVRFVNNAITFTNNIVAETRAMFSNQSKTSVPSFNNNNYFNAPNLTSTAPTVTASFYDDSASTLDPGFTSAETGNFTITNETVKDKAIGDPRWR